MEQDRQETLTRLMEEHGDRLYRLCLLLLRRKTRCRTPCSRPGAGWTVLRHARVRKPG